MTKLQTLVTTWNKPRRSLADRETALSAKHKFFTTLLELSCKRAWHPVVETRNVSQERKRILRHVNAAPYAQADDSDLLFCFGRSGVTLTPRDARYAHFT